MIGAPGGRLSGAVLPSNARLAPATVERTTQPAGNTASSSWSQPTGPHSEDRTSVDWWTHVPEPRASNVITFRRSSDSPVLTWTWRTGRRCSVISHWVVPGTPATRVRSR